MLRICALVAPPSPLTTSAATHRAVPSRLVRASATISCSNVVLPSATLITASATSSDTGSCPSNARKSSGDQLGIQAQYTGLVYRRRMAAPTCIYTDPKQPGNGPRLWMGSNHAWEEDVRRAFVAPSLSYAQGIIYS